MRRKRVAILVQGLYGGGMERVAAQLSIMLSDAGYDTYIIVRDFDKRKAYRYKGKIILMPFEVCDGRQSLGIEFVFMLHNAYLLKRCKKANKIDITISFAPEMNMMNMLSGTRDRKILTVHSCLSVRRDFTGLCYKYNTYRMYNYAYKVIAVSKWCKKDLVAHYGVNKNKVKVIYNPIENNGGQNRVLTKENNVLIVGRLQDIKQQWHIIRAFKMVIEKIPDAKLIIAGQGENRKYLYNLCADLGINNSVVFEGFVKEIEELYQQVKCVVFSSASEAFPCAVIEAISQGVPVVAADCPGGIREIVAGNEDCGSRIEKATKVSGGVLTPKLDGTKYDAKTPLTVAECELAKGIIYLLENNRVYAEVAENCLKISLKFNKNRIIKEWLELMGEMEEHNLNVKKGKKNPLVDA